MPPAQPGIADRPLMELQVDSDTDSAMGDLSGR